MSRSSHILDDYEIVNENNIYCRSRQRELGPWLAIRRTFLSVSPLPVITGNGVPNIQSLASVHENRERLSIWTAICDGHSSPHTTRTLLLIGIALKFLLERGTWRQDHCRKVSETQPLRLSMMKRFWVLTFFRVLRQWHMLHLSGHPELIKCAIVAMSRDFNKRTIGIDARCYRTRNIRNSIVKVSMLYDIWRSPRYQKMAYSLTRKNWLFDISLNS